MAKAYFSDISVRIKSILEETKNEVLIAVAWFTNPFLFKVVENLIDRSIRLQMIISDSEHNLGKLDFSRLQGLGGKVYVCEKSAGKFMHNKFCIVDNKTAITGSYNWSLNADKYFENIVVASDEAVVKPLSIYFTQILRASRPFGVTNYTKDISQEAKEDDTYYELQKEFARQVDESIKATIKIGVNIDTDNLYALINKYTPIGAAKLLTTSEEGKNLQPGFIKLAHKDRLDLTFEYLVTKPEFKPLFSDSIVELARNKLNLGRIEQELPKAKN